MKTAFIQNAFTVFFKKIIIEIDEPCYEDAINDTEWDTLSLGIYLKEKVKKSKTLQAEYEEIKKELYYQYPKNYMGCPELNGCACHFSLNQLNDILDGRIKEETDED